MKIFFAWHSLIEGEYRKFPLALSAAGNTVLAICPSRWKECGRQQRLKSPIKTGNFSLVPIPVLFSNHIRSYFYTGILKLVKYLRNFRPDIVHIFSEPYSLNAFQIIIISKLFAPHARIFMQTFENIKYQQPFPFSLIEKFNLSHTDVIATVPKEGESIWREKGFKKRIICMPVGIDDKIFCFANNRREGKIRLAYIGRIEKYKGIELLLNAFIRLKERFNNIELKIVGEGSIKTFLANKYSSVNVEFIEPMENRLIPQFFSSTDILVLPSLTTPFWKEQFGRVLVEAMACGVVPAGSSSGEIPNVIGDAGVIFKENDENALYLALEDLLVDAGRRSMFSKKCFERVKEYFTWDIVAGKLMSAYRNIQHEA